MTNLGPDNFNEREIMRRKKENHIILQLVLIVGTYVFGYFPSAGDSTERQW